ncbi:DUF2924 domain-containing protein [Sphingomicrobium clamense]|uniref:DUF2924 domain-containing protein n=1 Tax=Sphingomicrobium clamense TaxID=2851013 RepID=A0ABS6V870_9SPHN|nr:DUF2924 domain-containing protein [Sphingomicrobium sp. B8]MBW0145768.1 DUF2924 domain-containing protein [Sphingomicrobium sp. B8]
MSQIDAHLTEFGQLSRSELKDRWRSLYKTPPPVAFTPDLLARGLAYRLQEQSVGGLPQSIKTQLASRIHGSSKRGSELRPGNRLVRRWRGVNYVVDVTERGLVYDGERFGSLSEIATHITGTRWSGPRFFGLRR